MSILAQILSSRVRAELFRLLFGLSAADLHIRELARRSGFHEATVRQELRKLNRLDLVIGRRDGNRFYYRANSDHPLYLEIHGLVIKTTGLVELLAKALSGADIAVAFVFGSIARFTETAASDVDLMVIGRVGLRRLTSLLSGISNQVGREINAHSMPINEYRKRVEAGEHFVSRVLKGPRLFIVGSEHDLEAMERSRVAQGGTNQPR